VRRSFDGNHCLFGDSSHHLGMYLLVGLTASLQSRHLAIIAITLLPFLQWHYCHCQTGVDALITMASLPSLIRRHLCRCHNGVITLVALVPSPTLHRHCSPCCASVIVFILLTSLSSRCMGIITIVAMALLPPSSWCVCTVECQYNYLRLLLYAD
jgi:hypothetical protein